MSQKDQDTVISRQERVAKQQEILEKKRRAKAEYNVSSGKGGSFREERIQEHLERKKQHEIAVQGKKQEKSRKRFQKSYQSAVAFDDAEGVTVSQWFLSVCWLKIPVFGFLYALFLAFSPKVHLSKRNFARGYLIYRTLVLVLSITVLYVLYKLGVDLIEQLLSFLPQ